MSNSVRLRHVVLHAGMQVFDADGQEIGEISALRQPDEQGEYRDVARFHRLVPADDHGQCLAEAGFLEVSRGRLRRRCCLVPLSAIAAVKAGHIILAPDSAACAAPDRASSPGEALDPRRPA